MPLNNSRGDWQLKPNRSRLIPTLGAAVSTIRLTDKGFIYRQNLISPAERGPLSVASYYPDDVLCVLYADIEAEPALIRKPPFRWALSLALAAVVTIFSLLCWM